MTRAASHARPLITGWGHSVFGKHPETSLAGLIAPVVRDALDRSGVDPSDIDEVYLGHFNSGLLPLGFPSSLVLEGEPELWGVPATRVENACASGSAAVHQGLRAIRSGDARHVLVVGAEKMTHAPAAQVGAALLGADGDVAGHPSTSGFAGRFAEVAEEYQHRHGPIEDDLARIAAKSHRNAVRNPYAQLRKDLGEEFCGTVSERNPTVAGILRRTDCSPVSDGAAALVLSAEPSGTAATEPVVVSGWGQANDFLPAAKRDPLAFAATELAITRALDRAGVTRAQLDLAEVHDCFTIAELILYELLGLTPRGEGRRAIREGWVTPDGVLPVNVSGGLKSKGHPVGATGVSQHVIAAMQLTGTAGEMQLPRAHTALVQNMGGLGIANYASVLTAGTG